MEDTVPPLPTIAQGAALLEYLMSGQTMEGAVGRSVKSQEAAYHLAYTFYTQAKYAEAMRIFAFLLTSNHADRRFHNGFAACLQMQGRHQDAMKYYGIASMLDLTDPEPPLHTAECHLALGNRAEARQSLDYALTQARAHAHHRGFVERIEALLSFLDRAEAGGAPPAGP